jgi:hypothetical protein
MLALPGLLQTDRVRPQEPAGPPSLEIRVYLWDAAFRPIDPRDASASLHVRAADVLSRTLPMQFTHPKPEDALPADHEHAVRPIRGTPGWWAEMVLLRPQGAPLPTAEGRARALPEGWPARHDHAVPYLKSELDPLDLAGASELSATVVFRIRGEGKLAPGFRYSLDPRRNP